MNESRSDDIKEKSCCSSPTESVITNDLLEHWNKVYEDSVVSNLGWYEEDPEPSMRMIDLCNLDKRASLLNVGAGATTLVDVLVGAGYQNIIANDLSAHALDKLKDRLGQESSKVNWIIDDLTRPCKLNEIGSVDLWHDRAVLHFFNAEAERDSYFDLLKRLVKKNGFVIIAAFHLEGAPKCCGLPVHRYDAGMLHGRLGNDFALIESFDYTYVMPSGDHREYVYTLFKRNNS
ncbi:MAG: class I SAM-dependent methyltransferase [Bacteroidetes bacterium]|nr:MAG: class I SAM-dependent methyltransferase [Bacteroidota bacterium]